MPPPPHRGPSVITPHILNSHGLEALLLELKPPSNIGYSEAHTLYDDMRTRMQNLAYASDTPEVISIAVHLKVKELGKAKHLLVGVSDFPDSDFLKFKLTGAPLPFKNVSETQGNIPVHIGVRQLKTIAFYTILPAFLKWSNNYPLTFEDIRMRDKKWVEFVPAEPDINAIAKDFYMFKTSGKAAANGGKKVFRTGQAHLMLEIDCEKYQEILEYREQHRDSDGTKKGDNNLVS